MPGEHLVLRLAEIIEVDPSASKSEVGKLATSIRDQFPLETVAEYVRYLQVLFPVDINQGVVESLGRQLIRVMDLTPDFNAFARNWRAGKNQTVFSVLVSDMETPVSAARKLGQGQPFSFLLESMEGGISRGRYSIIGS